MRYLPFIIALLWPAVLLAQDDLEHAVGIPVMPGLQENSDMRVLFDKPDGRIMEAELVGNVSAVDVYRFYQESLLALGWQKETAAQVDIHRYYRENERLLLDVHDNPAGGILVRLSLLPIE